MKRLLVAGLFVTLSAVAAAETRVITRHFETPIAPGIGMPGEEVVKNAPVTAKIVTRSVQDLCDGNRIVNVQEEMFYRDAEGRERREIGSGSEQVVLIRDGSQRTFVHPAHGVAVPLPPMPPDGIDFLAAGPVFAPSVDVEIEADELPPPGSEPQVKVFKQVRGAPGAVLAAPPVPLAGLGAADLLSIAPAGESSVEPLGQKKIDGLRVEGTRYLTTIAADEIGNEKPIEVVKTTWYSPELRMMISSQASDPRAGEVTYTAEILSRQDPEPSLFEAVGKPDLM